MWDRLRDHSHSGGALGALIRFSLRALQFLFAIVVIGLYAVDISRAHSAGTSSDSRWAYAVVVAVFSAVSCIVYFVPFIKSYWFFAWDWILFILWVAVFGVFGNLYIKINPEPMPADVRRMKNAVWIDLINMLLWLITALYSTFIWFRSRGAKSTHTGRAIV